MNVDVESNKRKLLEIMASLTKTGEQGSLPKPSPAFLAAESYLGKSDFYVSVCGEIKQGKSSFINSLLGRDLLPTDVDVATSQVFRVSSSEDGSDVCHLVFEDGARTQIGIEELVHYGKERGANLLRDPKINGRSLAYIDVQVSAGFLPPGVHLLDTPGLGAVNPQHEAIANNAIERSDAVIFVSDVSRPLTAPELSILARIYKRTPNIILVQTKTDLLDEGKIRAVIDTNKQKIKEVLGGKKAPDLMFCPYSAVLVREGAKIEDANSSDRKTLLEEGHGLELLEQLQKLFFKTVGVYALSTAYSEAVGYFGLLLGELRKRKSELTASSEERAKLKEEAENALAEFNGLWGEKGTKTAELIKERSNVQENILQNAKLILSPGGKMQGEFFTNIDTLDTTDDTENYRENLHGWIHAAYARQLQMFATGVDALLQKRFAEFNISVAPVQPPEVTQITEEIDLPTVKFLDKVFNVVRGASMGRMAANIIDAGLVLLSPFTAGTTLLMIAAVESTVIGVGAYRGHQISKNTALTNQRNKLKQVVRDDILAHWSELTGADALACGSKLKEWVVGIVRTFADSMNAVITEKRKELESVLARLRALEGDLKAKEAELSKIVSLGGCVLPDGRKTGLLLQRDNLSTVRDYIMTLDNA